MPNDAVSDALSSAKDALAKANKFTETVEGNPTSSFAPKKPEPPRVPQARTSKAPSYSLARQAKALVSGYGDVARGLKSRQENVKQYVDAQK